ncbi:hypothetical protein [Halosolutus halophilus]|uniref:hypothetical protein n=1 Tax=Halosolutus halophilus TaxID=1552990 RepID=UPI0022352F09|nr:hypothetical protein [Halosolutus halophilus]
MQSATGIQPVQVPIDEVVIHHDGQRDRLNAAVDPSLNEFLLVPLYSNRTTLFSSMFYGKLIENQSVTKSVFLVDPVPRLEAALHRSGSDFETENTEIGAPTDSYSKR